MTIRHSWPALAAALFLTLSATAQAQGLQAPDPQPRDLRQHEAQQHEAQQRETKTHERQQQEPQQHHTQHPPQDAAQDRPQQHGGPPPSPYAGEQTRRIKSLADSDVASLLAGAGAAYAKAAELNGYPGPAHVIELRQQLDLSPGQLAASQALLAAHKARARALGQDLVEAERRLDALFADRRAQADTVEAATAEVGRISARLRAEHLNTHLQQTALLRPAQVQAYNQFRGYAAAPLVDGGRHPPN